MKIFTTLSLILLSLSPNLILAQDRLADIAPIDRKMRAIDSIELVRMSEREAIADLQSPAAALYPSWDNEYTRSYGVTLPSEYRIDLRNFCMPCDSRMVTSHYGYRRSFRRQHYGTDIKVFVGDTIRAAFSGKVRVVAFERYGYGNYVIIRHPNGLETVYGHMSRHLCKPNQIVRAGDVIGLGGSTGRSTGSHLHFETRFLGQFIDPERLFDFEAQDVKGDYYLFRSSGRGTMLAATDNVVGGEEEMDEETANALIAKQNESEAFQQKRIQQIKAKPRTRVHKVKSGETLSTIARKCGTTVDKLCRLNHIKRNAVLRPGQILKYS
ncbi:MAG: peptidoglycan DD-metalloendopeptidase family protein [Bacteroidaceae bacterium]|nr:peptidoglycan DD-metalloendopeptidase family protein [Bacteroidaceae bacterium]